MSVRPSTITIYMIILFLLIPQLNSEQIITIHPVQIGFSCCHFFNLDSGTPVYMHGEEVWLKAESDLTAVLRSPDQEINSLYLPANSSALLYRFRAEDPSGLWRLEVRSGGSDLLIPLHLVHPEAQASLTDITYNLRGTQLAVKGTLSFETMHQGGVLLLNRRGQVTPIDMPSTPFREDSLQAQIRWDPLDPRIISIEPFAPSLEGSNASNVWAEISLEIPLLKQVDVTQLVTLLPQVVTRTNRMAMNIESQPQQTLEIELPNLHQVGFNGQVPLRLGPIHLTIFVEIENVIYILTSDIILLIDGIVTSTASMIQIAPLLNPATFDLTDDLQQLSDYNLVLIAREKGVNVVWNKTITPPVTRIRVLNVLTDSVIDDYHIASNRIREITRVGPQSFAIPHDSPIEEIEIWTSGVQLQSGEFNPTSIQFDPLSTVEIKTSISSVHLRIRDAVGKPPSSGLIRLTRILGDNRATGSERSWKADDGTINLTLPRGLYEVELTIEGSTVTRQFHVNLPEESIDLTLHERVLAKSRNELILIGVGVLIIIVEALYIKHLWKSLKKPKTRSKLINELNLGNFYRHLYVSIIKICDLIFESSGHQT